MEQALAPGDVAAVIMETIPATYGFPLPAPGYLRAVKDLCERHGTLYIADEVQTGLMRTGELWGITKHGVAPDLLVTGKGLSGGMYPIAAVLATERAAAWMEADGFAHMSTFGGAEAGCIAALRGLEITTRPAVRTMSHHIAAFFTQGLDRIQAKYPDWFTGVRQDGLVMGLEFAHPEGATFVMRRLYSRGVWAIFSTLDPHVLQYKPGPAARPGLVRGDPGDHRGGHRGSARGRGRRARGALPCPRGRRLIPADTGDIPLGDLPSFPADPAARSLLTEQLGRLGCQRRAAVPAPVQREVTMADHDLSAGGDVLDRVTACARAALAGYGVRPDADVRLLNVSENATFLVTDAGAGRPCSACTGSAITAEQAIASELAWMDALRAEAGVRTPRVLPAADGRRIVSVTDRRCRAAPGDPLLRAVRVPAGTEPPGRTAAPPPPRTSLSSARSPRGCTRTPGTGTGPPGSPGSVGTSMPRSARSRGGVAGRTASASAPPRRDPRAA